MQAIVLELDELQTVELFFCKFIEVFQVLDDLDRSHLYEFVRLLQIFEDNSMEFEDFSILAYVFASASLPHYRQLMNAFLQSKEKCVSALIYFSS